MSTPKTKETIKHFLKELESPSKKLTDWEERFLESIAGQFEERGTLSDKQFEVLENLYAEKTA